MSLTHMIILGIIALIVIPPEKLPEVAREIARFISELKSSADQIMGELKKDAVFKPEDILDKNIKQKLADLQKDLNSTITMNPSPSKDSTPSVVTPNNVVNPNDQVSPATKPDPSSTDGGSSGTNGSHQS